MLHWTPSLIVDRLGGDSDMALQLVALFVTEYPNMLAAVRAGVASGDGDRIRKSAHALKGSVSNFLEDGPRLTALALEEAGREGRVAAAPALLEQLESEMEQVLTAMRAYAEGGETGSSLH